MGAVDIRRTVNAVERTAERVIKRVAFSVQGSLIRATPVDTGWARANWLVSIGRPVGQVAGSPEQVQVANAQQSAGQARLLVYTLNQGDIWLSNNVPYIQALNDGHSKQAPAGFVEQAIDTGIRSIAG